MSDHLANSRYSVNHGNFRISEFEREFVAFVESKPCSLVVERDTDTCQDVHKLRLTKQLPIPLKGIVFDVVSNLRAALDHAGYAVAIADGKKGNNAHFPFGIDAAERRYSGDPKIKSRSKDIRKEIFDVMFAFQPYQGGNDALFALNKLCNTHKHEIVVPTALSSGGYQVRKSDMRMSLGAYPWDSVKNEMEFARTEIGKELSGEFEFKIAVVFADIDIVRGHLVIDVLNTIRGEVERVLMAVENEAKRIGIFK